MTGAVIGKGDHDNFFDNYLSPHWKNTHEDGCIASNGVILFVLDFLAYDDKDVRLWWHMREDDS